VRDTEYPRFEIFEAVIFQVDIFWFVTLLHYTASQSKRHRLEVTGYSENYEQYSVICNASLPANDLRLIAFGRLEDICEQAAVLFAYRNWGSWRKMWIVIFDFPAEIRTGYLL